MPVHFKKDSKGCYAIWGKTGKRYYFPCTVKKAKAKAAKKAGVQGSAIMHTGWRETSGNKSKKGRKR